MSLLLPQKCPRIVYGCDVREGCPKCESLDQYIYCDHFTDGRWWKESRVESVHIIRSRYIRYMK